MAATLTSLMATLATSELTFSAGAGTRADWLQGQMDANLLPSLHEAVQLAGVEQHHLAGTGQQLGLFDAHIQRAVRQPDQLQFLPSHSCF